MSRNYSGSLNVLTKLGEETKLLKQLGEENVLFFIGTLLSQLKAEATQLIIEFGGENNNISIK